MSFSSLQFLVFFPVVTLLYYLLPTSCRWFLLLIASALFYMAFIPVYILILLFTIVVDYCAGIAIDRSEGAPRKWFLVLSIVANVGALAFFKYFNFAAENLNLLLGLGGSHAALPLLSIVLPIGLSFHTFQAMSYTIEVYRGNQRPERHFGIYALYVMFYPQLVAGPIERPQNLLHQFREVHRFRYDEVTSGLRLMAWGLFKKLVVADRMAIGVDTVYAAPRHFAAGQVFLATILFTFQLYADFSGYSDIARGSARVMGFTLMKNFDRPFEATNISDFWRRWHISLYSWFRDYLYRPIALAWVDWGKRAVVAAILVTFTISGLWHGAAWTFVIWGALHGIGVAAENVTRRWRESHALLPRTASVPMSVGATFAFVCFAFVFFRAKSVTDAWYIVTHLSSGVGEFGRNVVRTAYRSPMLASMGFNGEDTRVIPLAVATMLMAEHLQSRIGLEQLVYSSPRYVRWTAYYTLVAVIIFFGATNAVQPFIYFQF